MTIQPIITELNQADVQYVLQHPSKGYGSPENNLVGDAFELALGNWTGPNERQYVMNRLNKTIQFNYDYDIVSAPYNKKTDAKCRKPRVNPVNLLVNKRCSDVAYVQGRMVTSLEALKNGQAAKFEIHGWCLGSDASLFEPFEYEGKKKLIVYARNFQEMGSYLMWLRQP